MGGMNIAVLVIEMYSCNMTTFYKNKNKRRETYKHCIW